MASNILLVDDDSAMIQLMARSLSGLGQLNFATSGAMALQQMRDSQTDLVLLDAEMPGMSGFQVCEAMKADPALQEIPVIFVTGHNGSEFELSGFDVGAADFITKPVNQPILLARVKMQLQIKHAADEMRRISRVDALTELANHRWFDEMLEREWRRGLRGSDPISVMLIDVDHFKLFNERYGPSAADKCLRSVAGALRGVSSRPADVVARYGGDEFALLLPQTPRAGAEYLAHRMMKAVERLSIAHDTSPVSAHVTVSIGVACCDEQSTCGEAPAEAGGPALRRGCQSLDLMRIAERALYAAKRSGRAQAWRLDASDSAALECAEEISPLHNATDFAPL